MELPQTEAFIKRGIKMKKIIRPGYYVPGGLLSIGHDVPEEAEYKTVFSLEESEDMNENKGWEYENFDNVFSTVTSRMYFDLKNKS